jgi:tetratricopeptide (TPR) repeat protein
MSYASGVEAQESPDVLYHKMLALYEQGNYREALPIARELLEMSKKENGPESTETISLMRYVAQMDTNVGDVGEAEGLLLRAEAILSKNPTPTAQYARTLGDLSKLYVDRNELQKAEKYLRSSIAVLEKIAPDSRDLRTDLNNLAALYERRGQPQEALAMDERVVAIQESSLPSVDPDLAFSLIARGHVYSELGQYNKSDADLKRALSILQTVKGPSSRAVAEAFGVLANNELELNRLDESREHFQEALGIYEQLDGSKSTDVAYILGSLAIVDGRQEKLGKAQDGFTQAIAILESGWGPNDPHIAAQLKGLGQVYSMQGKLDEAETALLRAVGILELKYGGSTIYLAPVFLELAKVERKKKDLARAMYYIGKALDIDQSLPEPPPWRLAREFVQETFIHLEKGNCVEADSSSTRALELEQLHEIDDPSGYRDALFVRSKALDCLGRPEEAAHLRDLIKTIHN